jgi:hypothetical protein
LVLTIIGAIAGPFLAYRWVMDAVRNRELGSRQLEQEGEPH